MTCPNCGMTIQPHDLYCMSCGHAVHPADPTRRLDDQAAAYQVEAAQPVYAAPEPEPFVRPAEPPYAPPPVAVQHAEQRWASGSSFPAPNPYAPPPNTVSPGTILNGRPVGRRNRSGPLQGLGAAIVALGLILGKFGSTIAGLGIWKLGLLFWLLHGHSWIFVLIVLLVVGAIWRSQTA